MRAHNRGATMIDEIRKVVRGKAVIERNQNGTNLRNAIEGFEHGMSIRRNVSNAIAFFNAKREQSRRPSVTAVEELLISQPQFTINNRFTFRVKFARASGKFKGCQWKFHRNTGSFEYLHRFIQNSRLADRVTAGTLIT